MKKSTRTSLTMIAMLSAFGFMASGCKKTEATSSTSGTGSNPSADSSSTPVVSRIRIKYKGGSIDDGANQKVFIGETVDQFTVTGASSVSYTSSDTGVLDISNINGLLTPKTVGTADITVVADTKTVVVHFTVEKPGITAGGKSYATVDYNEKANILATLEKYAVNNYLTGITMFSDAGHVVYNNRYVPTPSENISGYGWGTMREGALQKDASGNIIPLPESLAKDLGSALAGPATDKNPLHYYTTGTTALPKGANAMDATGTDVSDVSSHTNCGYYATRLNSDNNGYEWYPQLAKDKIKISQTETKDNSRPTALNESYQPVADSDDSANYNTRWRVYLKTGDDAPTYATGYPTGNFNGRKVTLDDYLTPIKFLLTGWNNQYRAAETTVGISGLAGTAEYLSHTSKKPTTNPNDGNAHWDLWDETAWNKYVGDKIKTGTDANGNEYIDFTLNYACTQFYAMYYLSSSFYSPLPADFLEIWEADGDYFGKGTHGSDTPVQTMIGVGPYYISTWDSTKMAYSRNPYYDNAEEVVDGNTRKIYQIPGFAEYKQNGGASGTTASDVICQYFEAGQVDAFAPNKDQIKNTYKNETGSSSSGVNWHMYKTKGSANFKLNVNSTTGDQWNKFFGTSGSVYAHSSSDTIAKVAERDAKFYLSNSDFLDFLNYSINRPAMAQARGMDVEQATQEYFSDNYMIDPENGVSYNSTAVHQSVLADRHNDGKGTDSFTAGYDQNAAYASLDKFLTMVDGNSALQSKLKPAGGTGTAGSSANPYKITIEMSWMNQSDSTDYSDLWGTDTDGGKSIRGIFAKVCKEKKHHYVLDIQEPSPDADYNVVYTKMEHGEYDLGFGAVSGNDLNPLNFFEVLKSDNSSGFTLNWSKDTSERQAESPIVYDGQTWSFDSLWQAADTAVAIDGNGDIAKAKLVSTPTKKTTPEGTAAVCKVTTKSIKDAGGTITDMSLTNGDQVRNVSFDDAQIAAANTGNSFDVVVPANMNKATDSDSNNVGTCLSARLVIRYSISINGKLTTLNSTLTLPTGASF